ARTAHAHFRRSSVSVRPPASSTLSPYTTLFRSKTESVFAADHPEVFAAEDNGITPIEYLLVGLASCLTAGIASVAQNRGIQLRSDRKSTRLNSSHVKISYAVFCLTKKTRPPAPA